MPYSARERFERDTFQQFEKSLPTKLGRITLVCPQCRKTHSYDTQVNGLCQWAYKDGDRDYPGGYNTTINGTWCKCFR